jgi:hypothetical protein
MFLPDKFIECARAHAVSEGTRTYSGGIIVRDGREEIHEFVISNL